VAAARDTRVQSNTDPPRCLPGDRRIQRARIAVHADQGQLSGLSSLTCQYELGMSVVRRASWAIISAELHERAGIPRDGLSLPSPVLQGRFRSGTACTRTLSN
jgi:hypothetical protein